MRSTKLPSWISGPFAKLAGLAPVPVAPHVFSVSAERLDYARFERGAEGFECRELHSLDLPENSFQRGHLAEFCATRERFRKRSPASSPS